MKETPKSLAVLIVASALVATGCRHVHPWERSKLAHPTMTQEVSGVAQEHMYGVHEGAAGGGAASEGGCGCN